ncbi:MAG: hypothetical protein EBS23_09405, partial [Betaproteobacteria bacterium]|nr:hypothetical protein [Betaproteobacteria bacterium]
GLCMAESRRLSNLGAVGLLVRDQATLRDSLDVLVRHQGLLNGSLTLMLEQHADLVVLREEVPLAKSCRSSKRVAKPRDAASTAIPNPVAPPPTTSSCALPEDGAAHW